MEVNLEIIMDNEAKLGQPITININIDDCKEAMLIVQKRKYRDNGSNRVSLESADLKRILLENNVI
ncbi:hypothetical protein EMGBS15_06010 [Filimonas sp.]|nr:hypothetical protein EMGBS15_06010 [Filimonas sp.]